MTTPTTLCRLAVGGLLLGAAGTVSAMPIQPDSYTFTPAAGTGTYDYHDAETPSKLTDGSRGDDNWTDPYEPWVGWQGIAWDSDAANYLAVDVSINFLFHGGTVGSVVVGTNQDAVKNWNVVLPSLVELYLGDTLLDGVYTPFSAANSGGGAADNNGRRHELTLAFAPVTFDADTTLTLRLNNATNFALATSTDTDTPIDWDNDTGSTQNGLFWIFLDEVSFDTQPVPEPSTLVLLASGLVGVATYRRRGGPH